MGKPKLYLDGLSRNGYEFMIVEWTNQIIL